MCCEESVPKRQLTWLLMVVGQAARSALGTQGLDKAWRQGQHSVKATACCDCC